MKILERFKNGEFAIADSTWELVNYLHKNDSCSYEGYMVDTTLTHVDAFGECLKSVMHGNNTMRLPTMTSWEFLQLVSEEKGEIKMTEKDLKVFDLVSHEDGTLQMVVEIDGEMGFSLLDGCGNGFYGNPFEYNWSYGDIVKIWRPKHRGYFGTFLSRLNIADLNLADYFDLVWEQKSEAQIELEKAKELLREAHEAVEKAEEKLAKERGM